MVSLFAEWTHGDMTSPHELLRPEKHFRQIFALQKGKRKKEEENPPHLDRGGFSSMQLAINAEQGPDTFLAIARRFSKQRAELAMFSTVLLVPVMQRTKNPFVLSNGKQEVVHNGPYSRTHSGR